MANIISFGAFDKVKRRLGYDDIYHNYLIVKLKNGKTYKMEKNHVVNIEPIKASDLTNQTKNIPLNGVNTDLQTLINNASKNDSKFWRYDPADKNCQWFAHDILKDNNLDKNVTDKETQEIINPQDGKALIDSLGALKNVPKAITDLAAGLDTLVAGKGLKKNNLSVQRLFDMLNGQS